MQILYLGTGASEGIPGPFCPCEVCAMARREGGRNIRRRSSILIDGKILMDISPDFWSQSLQFSLDPSALRHVLITHHHAEHIYLTELHNMAYPYRIGDDMAFTLYASETVLSLYKSPLEEKRRLELEALTTVQAVRPFETFAIEDYSITPLPARHSKGALIYLIEKEERAFLYGTDSGFFPESTWDFLVGRKLHAISLDCNNPFNSDTPNHMCIEDAVTTRRRLFQLGCIDSSARIHITHIAHNGNMGHNELQERMTLYGITVAYDGLKMEV